MATVIHRALTSDTGNTPNPSDSFDPTLGGLLVVFVTKEDSTAMASADLTSSISGNTFTLIRTQTMQPSAAAIFGVFVANQFIETGEDILQTVTIGSGSDPGAGSIIGVFEVTGLPAGRVGATAVRQQGGTDETTGPSAPSAAFPGAALTTNPCVGALAAIATGIGQPTGWTEGSEVGYTTGQDSAMETCFRSSGETGTTITWAGSEASWSAIILELDAATPAPELPLGAASAVATAALALTAATTIALGAAVATSTAALALTAPTTIPLGAASAQSTATLALTVPTQVPLGAAGATSSATLSVHAPTGVVGRRFDGVDDEIVCAIGGSDIAFGTLACLVRRTQPDPDTSTAEQWIGNWTSGNVLTTAKLGQEPGTDGHNPRGWTNFHSPFEFVPDDGWAIIVITKTTGLEIPRFHHFVGGSWVHGNAEGASANAASQAGGSVRFATIVNGLFWTQQDLAIAAEWDVALNDDQVEELSANSKTRDWYDCSGGTPVGLWDFSQASAATPVVDLTGNGADETSSTGTTVIDDGPVGWTYGLAVDLPLDPAAATSTATLALTAPTEIPLAASAATSTAALALNAPTQLPLQPSAAVSTASLEVTIPSAAVELPLQPSDAVSTASLALNAPTQLPLQGADAVSSAALALTAPVLLQLEAAAGLSTAALVVTAPGVTYLPLDPADATSSATLALTAPTQLPLAASTAVSTTALEVTIPSAEVELPLQPSVAVSGATLALNAPTGLPLQPSTAASTAALEVTIPSAEAELPLQPSVALSSASLALTAPTQLPLQPSVAVATTALEVTAPAAGIELPLAPANAVAATSLALSAATGIPLSAASATLNATLLLTAMTELPFAPAIATSTATLALIIPARRWDVDTDSRWAEDTDTRWPATVEAGRW